MVSWSIRLYTAVLVAELALGFETWRQHDVLEAWNGLKPIKAAVTSTETAKAQLKSADWLLLKVKTHFGVFELVISQSSLKSTHIQLAGVLLWLASVFTTVPCTTVPLDHWKASGLNPICYLFVGDRIGDGCLR